MKTSLRLVLLACASSIGLALAAPALATYAPSLTIEQSSYKLGAATTADVFLFAPQNDDPTAKLTIFSPAGYGVNLSQAPGTKLGRAIAVVSAGQLGGAPLPLSGDVVVANPTDPTVMATSVKCTGSPTNQAVLALNLSLQGQTVPFLVFANKVGALATFQICVPYPDNAPFGARVLQLDATIKGVFTNASAKNGYEWSSIFTPYAPATKTPNPAGTIEWRTYVGLPSSLTIAKAKAKKGLKLVGKLTVQGVNPNRIRLGVYSGKKAQPAPNAVSGGTGKRVARTPKLPTSGRYSWARPSVKFTTFFQTRFENYVTTCSGASPSGLPVPCKGEDLAAMTSSQVRATKPKKRR